MHVWHLFDDWSDVIDANLTVFVTLNQQKLASIGIIVGIDGSDGHFLLDAHIVQLRDEFAAVSVGFGRRRRPHDPDTESTG